VLFVKEISLNDFAKALHLDRKRMKRNMMKYFIPSPLFERVERARVEDKLVLSGPIGDHETIIMIARGELGLETGIGSDTAPLYPLVREILYIMARLQAEDSIHCLRDLTRGGVATTLNEIALGSDVCVQIDEARIPVREEMKGACEILGLDQLYVTNEGKLIAVVASEIADTVVAGLRKYPNGRDACVIGEVKAEPRGMVVLGTIFSGNRIVDMLVSEPAPRIC
jgi:hydrogenase expression/formation protein HypE